MASTSLIKKNQSTWYDRAIIFCLYSLVILIPVIFWPGLQNVFSMPKLLILRIVTFAIILLWGCKIFVEDKFIYRKSWLNVFLLIFAGVSVVNTIFSTNIYTSFYGQEDGYLGIFTILIFLFLTFCTFNFLKDPKQLLKLILISFYTSSALAVYGLLQYFGVGQAGFNWSQDPTERVFATLGHGNHFGAYLGMNILLAFYIFSLIKNKKQKWLLTGGLILQTIVLFLTGSRGAIFALLTAILITLVFAAKKHSQKLKEFARKSWKYFASGIIVLILASVIFSAQIKKIPMVQRSIDTINNIQQGHIPDRLSWWLSSLAMIKDKPFLGFGLSTFRDNYNQYRRTDYLVPGPGNIQDSITPEAAHNEYLNLAVTQGLIGLLAFLILIGFALKQVAKPFYLSLCFLGGLLVYLLQIFFNFPVIATAGMFFLLLGAAVSAGANNSALTKINCKSWVKYLLSVAIFIAVSFGAISSFHEVRAEYFYKQAQLAASAQNWDQAIQNYQKAILDKPYEYAYYQAFADFALKNSASNDLTPNVQKNFLMLAIANYQKAIQINSNHPSLFYNLGLADLQLFMKIGIGDYWDQADQNFNLAIPKSPNNPLYPYQIGQAYLQVGNPGTYIQAITAFEKALSIRKSYKDSETILQKLKAAEPNNFVNLQL